MITSQATPSGDPREGSLHHPSPGQGNKTAGKPCFPIRLLAFSHEQAACRDLRAQHGLHLPPQMLLEPVHEGATVMAISPEQLEARQSLAQRKQQEFRSLLV